MFKVSKVLVLSLLVVGLCSPLAFATTSRVAALAGASNYLNDDSDIFRWYGTLPSYSKMVMAEVGQSFSSIDGNVTSDFQALGFTHNWGEDHWLGTWAVFLFMNSVEDGSFTLFNPLGTPGIGANYVGSTLGLAVPSTKFAVAWGKDLSSLSIGLNFTRSDVSTKFPGGATNDLAFTTLGGGVRWDMNESTYGDAAVTLGFAGGDTLGGFDKNMAFNIEGRLFWEFIDNATLVPYFGYNQAEFSIDAAPAPNGDKWNEITFGASLNFDVNTNNLLIFAADFQSLDWQFSKADGDETELSTTILPKFYCALESDVTSWFTARIGATKTMAKFTAKNAAGDEVEFTNSELLGLVGLDTLDDFTWHLGGGFHVGEWDIDAVFSHELPFRLGYWLTGFGVGDPDPVVSRVSATYRF